MNTTTPERGAATPAHPSMARPVRRAAVFEDETCVRELIGRLLEQLGFDVRTYDSPAREHAALEADVIVSDNHMPELAGIQYARTLRDAGEKRPHIALMSGDWRPEELREAEHLGCTIFHKPFALESLSRWIASLPD